MSEVEGYWGSDISFQRRTRPGGFAVAELGAEEKLGLHEDCGDEGVGGGAKMCVAKNPLTGKWETSLCIELGVGVGGGLEISPLAGVDSTGVNALAGISASCRRC